MKRVLLVALLTSYYGGYVFVAKMNHKQDKCERLDSVQSTRVFRTQFPIYGIAIWVIYYLFYEDFTVIAN